MNAASFSIEEQRRILMHGVEEVVPEGALDELLRRAQQERRPLRIKLGIDPTASDIHLGFAVVLLPVGPDYALRAASSSAIQRFQFSSSGSRKPQLARCTNRSSTPSRRSRRRSLRARAPAITACETGPR